MRLKQLLIIFLCCTTPQLLFANGKKVTKIVLDAGHGGKDGGEIICVGTPETIASSKSSHTARFLKPHLEQAIS